MPSTLTQWSMGPAVIGSTYDRIGSSRCFGIELEVSDANHMHGLHGNTPFEAKSDGSVHGDGREFASPILSGNCGLQTVENFLEYARNHQWSADASCGFHLHVDTRNLTGIQKRKLAWAYARTQSLWFLFVNTYRRNCSWCLPYGLTEENIETLKAPRGRGARPIMQRMNRSYWNVMNSRHGTIEVRLHQGTVNIEQVANWIKMHLWFTDYVTNLKWYQLERRFAGASVQGMFQVFRNRFNGRTSALPQAEIDTLLAFYAANAAGHGVPV